jgi:cysteine desulfurase/selenocysteine lyase
MIYMDNAATSWPKPDIVYQAVLQCMKHYSANPGRSGHKMSIQAGNILLYTREMLCQLFNVEDPFRIIFTSNCTESLNLAIKGSLSQGDHVITTSMEHNSVVRPLKHLEKMDVDVTFVKADSKGVIDPADIQKAIRCNTQLIVTTHASNVTGTIVPVQEIGKIARDYGIPYLLDAAQTAGSIPMDFSKLPVDMVAFPGHKGLLGPQGTGVLYLGPGIELKTLKEGGTGSRSESLYQPDFIPDRYESGTLNTPGIAGLGAGVKYILSTGQHKLLTYRKRLEKLFIEALSCIRGISIYGPMNLDQRSEVLSINVGNCDSSEICNLLDEKYDIAVRGSLHCAPLAHQSIGTLHQGTVRFSPGIFNTLEEVKQCIKALEELSRHTSS